MRMAIAGLVVAIVLVICWSELANDRVAQMVIDGRCVDVENYLSREPSRIDWVWNVPRLHQQEGKAPLIVIATVYQRYECMEMLLSRGANPDLVDGSGRTSLEYAILALDASGVRLLLRYGASVYLGKAEWEREVSPAEVIASVVNDDEILRLVRSAAKGEMR
jgi:hypothetical protein